MNDFESVISINSKQHKRIQNLQKVNIFLKAKLKELQENKAFSDNYMPQGKVGPGSSKLEATDDYNLVSIGHVDRVTHHNDLLPYAMHPAARFTTSPYTGQQLPNN